MTPTAIVLVLASAALHATWNLLAKKRRITLAFYAAMSCVGAAALSWEHVVSPIRPSALPPAFWRAVAGMLVGETLYGVGLPLAYRSLDLSVAYPVARALPLPMLAAATAALGLGAPLPSAAWAGFAAVCAGSLLLPLPSFGTALCARPSAASVRGWPAVVAAAAGTALYTLFDSQAMAALREAAPAGTSAAALALRWYSLRAPAVAALMWCLALATRRGREDAAALVRSRDASPLLAGTFSCLTYMTVLAAMGFVTNVSYVQALRQAGLVVGAAEGVVFLRERLPAPKVVGLALVLAGLVAAALA